VELQKENREPPPSNSLSAGRLSLTNNNMSSSYVRLNTIPTYENY